MSEQKNASSNTNINLYDFFYSSLKTFFSYVYAAQNFNKMLAVHFIGSIEIVINTFTPIWLIKQLKIARDQSDVSISIETWISGSALLLSSFILPRARHLLIGSVRRDVQQTITMDMVRRVYDGPLDEHMAAPTGDLVATVSKNYAEIEKVMPISEELLNTSLETLMKSVLLFRLYGMVGFAPILVLIPYLLIAFVGEVYTGLLKLSNSHVMVKSFDQLLETVNNYTVAQQNGHCEREVSKLDKQIKSLGKSYEIVNQAEEKATLLVTMINRLSFLAVFAYVFLNPPVVGFWLTENFLIFAFYMLTTAMRLENLPPKINSLLNGISGAFLVDKFFKTHPVIPDPVNPVHLELKQAPRIEFKNVNFSYKKDFPSLVNVNLVVEPGKTVVIMGPTGCGKSTLFKILQRLYDNFTGEILVDNVNVKNVKLAELRRFISVVSQDTGLVNDTLLENIRYSDPSADEKDAYKALQFARYALDRDRLATQVEKGGANFSGGEKQRVLIARALLKGGGFIFLGDEMTSALDQTTSKEVFQTIENLGNDVTKIIVTHDPNIVKNANLIVCMKAGKITQQGLFHELIKDESGDFYGLYKTMCDKLGINISDIVKSRSATECKEQAGSSSEFTDWIRERRHAFLKNAAPVNFDIQSVVTAESETAELLPGHSKVS